jgi:hypothetical protein
MAAGGGQGFGLNIWANTAQLVEGINKANKSIDSFASTIKRTMGAIGVGFAVHQIIAFTKETLKTADALAENAQKAGIAATSLKLYNVMAEISGTSSEKLLSGIGILSKNMAGLAKEGSGADRVLQKLGVDTEGVRNGTVSTEQAIMKISASFSVMKDGAGKTAMAMAAFGKSGKEMIPFLNEGPKAFTEMQKRLESLGFVFNEVSIQKAAKLNDEFDLMGKVIKNLGSQVVMGLVPSMLQILSAMSGFQVKGEGFKTVGEAMGEVLKFIASSALSAAKAMEKVVTIGQWMSEKRKEAPIKSLLGTSNIPALGPQLGDIDKRYEKAFDLLSKPFSFDMPKKKTGEAPDIANVNKEVEKLLNSYQKLTEQAADWGQAVERNNPLIDKWTKEMMEASDKASDLYYELGKLWEDGLSDEAVLKLTNIINKTEELALAQIEQAKVLQESTDAADEEFKQMQKNIDLEQRWIDFINKEDSARVTLISTIQKQRIAEEVALGIKNKAQGYTAGYGIDVNDVRKRASIATNVPSTSDFGIDEKVLEESRIILGEINKLSLEYFANMASYDTAKSVWTQENEALAAFAASWSVTKDELITGSLDTAQEMGQIWGDLSQQIGSAMTTSIVSLVQGTFDAKKAVGDLAASILTTLVGSLIKLGVQQLIMSTIGNTLLQTQAGQITTAMTEIAASAGTAASMMSMATYGSSATIGAGVYAGMLGATMALNASAIAATGGSVAMAEGGIINEHIIGRGRSGQMYEFGEEGPERVTPMKGGRGASNLTVNIYGDVLNSHDELARKLIPAIRKAEYDGV